MTPSQSMMILAAIMIAPHVSERWANKYTLVCLLAGLLFWWAE